MTECCIVCDRFLDSLGIIIFSFGSNYHSCPFRGSSSVTLTTLPLPASLIVRSVGRNDSWLSQGPWEPSELDAAPVTTYSLTIVNDMYVLLPSAFLSLYCASLYLCLSVIVPSFTSAFQ